MRPKTAEDVYEELWHRMLDVRFGLGSCPQDMLPGVWVDYVAFPERARATGVLCAKVWPTGDVEVTFLDGTRMRRDAALAPDTPVRGLWQLECLVRGGDAEAEPPDTDTEE